MQAMHSRRLDDRRRRPCARRRWLRDPSGSRLFNQGGWRGPGTSNSYDAKRLQLVLGNCKPRPRNSCVRRLWHTRRCPWGCGISRIFKGIEGQASDANIATWSPPGVAPTRRRRLSLPVNEITLLIECKGRQLKLLFESLLPAAQPMLGA